MKPLPNDFFEFIKSNKLKHSTTDDTIVKSDELNILYSTKNNLSKCVGFKNNHSVTNKEPFFLQHQDLYNKTKELYTVTFENSIPELIAYFYDEQKSWVCFLFADTHYREKALSKKEQNLRHTTFEKDNLIASEVTKIFEFGFFPVIGVTNDYGFGKNPAWYLMLAQTNQDDDDLIFKETSEVGLKSEDKNFPDENDTSVAGNSEHRIFGDSLFSTDSYLCVERSAFDGREKIKFSDRYFESLPNLDSFYNEVIKITSEKFGEELNNFLDALKNFSKKNVEKEIFCSIVLDLYNLNLKITSHKSDKDYNRQVRGFYLDSFYFTEKYSQDPKWSDFITYVIRRKYVNFKNLKFEDVIDVLQEKHFYKTFIKRFQGFYKSEEKVFTEYCTEQLEAVNKLKKEKLLNLQKDK
jgi:hypothetical protein